jgi:hypothetical protein
MKWGKHNEECNSGHSKLEVPIMTLMKNQTFKDITPCQLVNTVLTEVSEERVAFIVSVQQSKRSGFRTRLNSRTQYKLQLSSVHHTHNIGSQRCFKNTPVTDTRT